MSFTRPSLQTLIQRAQGDLSSRTEGSAYISHSVERALANVLAAMSHGMHGHLEWVHNELFPTTATIDGLLAWGSIMGLPRKVASFAERTVTFTGTNGTVVPVGAVVQDDDDLTYTVTVGGTVALDTVTVTVRADTAGTASNLANGAPVSLVAPIAGLSSDGVVASTVVDATDLEDVEDYRDRILGSLRTPPAGGGPGDYVTWAKEVAGVTRAWEYGNRAGIGTVSVAFVRDNDASIIPDAGEVFAVQNYLDSVKPLDVRAVYVQAPVEVQVGIVFTALEPNTSAVRAAITAELESFFRTTELEQTIALSQLDEAISAAAGEVSHTMVTTPLSVGQWEILTLGPIVFPAT